MKVLVTFWTQTGNTRKIAEAIFDSLLCKKEIKAFDEVDTLNGFDVTFIGFPVMQFGPPHAAKKFIASHAPGKTIALFLTHATPSDSEDQNQQELLMKALDNCRSVCSDTNLVGIYHCMGELSPKIANELLASGIPMLMKFADMRHITIGHPDSDELEQAREFAVRLIPADRIINPS